MTENERQEIKRPLFRWPGSKWLASARFPRPLPGGRIIEPFAGSACYATRYGHIASEVLLIEKDPSIAELLAWLSCGPSSSIRELPGEFEVGFDLRNLQCCDEAKNLIRRWQRVGRSECWTVSKFCGMNSGLWCASTRDDIATACKFLDHWRVLEGDWTLALETKDYRKSDTLFLDPPYKTKNIYKEKAPIDYRLLAEFARSFPGQVIACEMAGADWLPFNIERQQVTGRRQKGCGVYAKEAIWHKPFSL
jgi:site-specific DNA-adenine methylase